MSYKIGNVEVPASTPNIAPAAVVAQGDAKKRELEEAKKRSGGGGIGSIFGSGGLGTLLVLGIVGVVGYREYKKKQRTKQNPTAWRYRKMRIRNMIDRLLNDPHVKLTKAQREQLLAQRADTYRRREPEGRPAVIKRRRRKS